MIERGKTLLSTCAFFMQMVKDILMRAEILDVTYPKLLIGHVYKTNLICYGDYFPKSVRYFDIFSRILYTSIHLAAAWGSSASDPIRTVQ